MKKQTKLSEADALRLQILDLQAVNVNLQAQLVALQGQLLDKDRRLAQARIQQEYGNRGEMIEIGPDYSITRKAIQK